MDDEEKAARLEALVDAHARVLVRYHALVEAAKELVAAQEADGPDREQVARVRRRVLASVALREELQKYKLWATSDFIARHAP